MTVVCNQGVPTGGSQGPSLAHERRLRVRSEISNSLENSEKLINVLDKYLISLFSILGGVVIFKKCGF